MRLLALLAALAASLTWQSVYLQTRASDATTLALAHAAALPLVAHRRVHPALPPLGCALMGASIGMLVIDLAFDLHLVLAPDSLDARRLVYAYYHTMLNSAHVNGTLGALVLAMALGVSIGVADALGGGVSARRRRAWLALAGLNAVGNGHYLSVVMPRYLEIRHARAFSASQFDGWWEVLRARCILVASLFCGVLICGWLSLLPHERDARARKVV